MPVRLSLPLSELKPHYPVVVVGSGYGAAIVASRLARAGQHVCVLERGRELQPGEYPDTQAEALREVQLHAPPLELGRPTGLYDFRFHGDLGVFVGCGLGGTSLVNANVVAEADPRLFEDPAWPQALREDAKGPLLQEAYGRARAMLAATPFPRPVDSLPKLRALRASADALQLPLTTPPLAVNFELNGNNPHGVPQKPCDACGDCVTGCNRGAKNTLLMNYLPDARAHGADIFCEVRVHHVERQGARWLVHCQPLESGRERWDAPCLTVSADMVVLGAGALGSTEILLRSRDAGLSLSPRLGKRFSGNGDVLGFSYNGDSPVHGIGLGAAPEGRKAVGPTITGLVDGRRKEAPLEEGYVLEEGAIPAALAGNLLSAVFATAAKTMGRDTDGGVADAVAEARRELESLVLGPGSGAMQHTQTFLVMSHDGAGGELRLEEDRLKVCWPGAGGEPHYQRLDEVLHTATRALGGTWVENPLSREWTGQDLITVHPLGGCGMGEDAEGGVVDHAGRVFSGEGATVHPGLYVCDGSVLPRSLGVNPLLTISALAERTSALMAQEHGWRIDYASQRPLPPPAAPRPGLCFTERMAGHVSTRVTTDFRPAEEQGRVDHSPFEFLLTVSTEDVEAFLAGPRHEARIVGTARAPCLSAEADGTPRPLTVTDGRFVLFRTDDTHVGTKRMEYTLRLTSPEGRSWHFEGFKVIHDDAGLDVWEDTTTLFVTLREEGSEGPVVARGVLRLSPADFARQLTTLEVTRCPEATERLRWTVRFGRLFAGMLWQVYGGVLESPDTFGPPTQRKRRPLRAPAPRVYPLRARDGAQLLLTRYQGGSKGPVLLTHGLGVTGGMYTLDTVETNLVEYLCAHGYDVWNAELRMSIAMPASRTRFSLEALAEQDWPALVGKVRAETGRDVQVMAHCVSSLSFAMSLLGGHLGGVRSAVCSQLSVHQDVPPLMAFKAGLHLPDVLDALGVDALTAWAGEKPGWLDRLFDQALTLHPVPADELCNSPVCHRCTFMYGLLWEHANLNEATHATLHETFGVANIEVFEHLAACVRAGHVVDRSGRDVYLAHPERMRLPVCFIHGAENQTFLPETTRRTYEWLRAANGPALYSRHQVVGYGHLDCWIGREAARDVFPLVLAHLERTG